MAEVAASTPALGAQGLHPSFVWRRLHSLSGLIPVGAYLCYHIFENMTALRGPQAYDEMVNKVNTMLPRLYFFGVELAVVVVPLFFHALYGLYIASTGQANTGAYPYASNWAYWMQRISGYVAFAYVLIHMGVLRFSVTLLGRHIAPHADVPGKLDLVTYRDVAAHLGNPDHLAAPTWMAGNHMFVIYIVGTLLTIYHFTNGLNGFAWTWGIAVGRVAQRRVKMIAWILFVALSVATLNILFQLRFSANA